MLLEAAVLSPASGIPLAPPAAKTALGEAEIHPSKVVPGSVCAEAGLNNLINSINSINSEIIQLIQNSAPRFEFIANPGPVIQN